MKKISLIIVFVFLLVCNGYKAQIIIEEEFNGGTTPPAGWIFTSITATLNSVSNYGKSQPSVVMDATGDQITSPTFVAGTANKVTFWAQSTGVTPLASDILNVQYFNGSWNSCTPATFTFNTTARMFDATFPNTATRVRVNYSNGGTANVAIDDFTVLNNTGTCTATGFLWFTSIVYNSCNATCEGTDEFLSFQNGNSSLSLNDLEITVPTSGASQEGTTFCGNSANPCDEFFTTNATYVSALNAVAGCSGFFLSPPGNVIPANGRVIVFMGNPPSATVNFGTLCGSGGNYYCVFASNTGTTNCSGRYSNNVNALRFTTIRNRNTGCSVERSFNPSLGINADGDIVAFSPTGTETYISNPGCAGFAVLPIELTDFYATPDEEGVRLTWKVASEINTVEYKIEKSLDGVNWNIIGSVLPDKIPNKNLVYQSMDYSPAKGLNYYRLSDMDTEGKINYQPIISFNYLNKNNNFSYTQNDDELIITSNNSIHKASINLLDVTGRIIKTSVVDANTPAFISKRDIGKGLFLLQCETYPQLGVSKIIVN